MFDIDNTTLETHYNLGLVIPAIPSMLRLARAAEQQGAAIFFVTARPFLLAPVTAVNLSAVGYPVDGVYDRGLSSLSAGDYQDAKTASRIQIEKLGYTIVANIGNSASDLAGGHAERTFKLPDYDGALS
ncbi:HAD family acid phosphatase [Nocardia fluminea]|uniref:HAD family acid phosphatase n=1 Tax=Nocardia fluminea TaxID=134984 RepID=UPI00380118B0